MLDSQSNTRLLSRSAHRTTLTGMLDLESNFAILQPDDDMRTVAKVQIASMYYR